MNKLLLIGSLLLLMTSCASCNDSDKNVNGAGGEDQVKNTTTVNYIETEDIFPNPERGFYRYTETNLGSKPTMLSETTLKGYRQNNFSLIYRIFYLKEFKDKALSEEALNQLDTDMNTLRRSGLKCVLRFAYSSAEQEADAPLNIVLQHLDQLKPYLAKHADMIAVLQAGFIGAWGEWYYTSNKLNTTSIRATILNKILEVLPPNRMVQVRTPSYKTDYVQHTEALKPSEAFSGTKAARVGHHNDCFMASDTDYGTYQNATKEKAYLKAEGLYVPIGGETCPPSGIEPADCGKAQEEMRNLRWSYLNEDYYKGVNDRWKTQGCMDNIIRELGYRFVLTSGIYSKSVKPGGTCSITLKLINMGYSCLYNPRHVEFILKNENAIYKLKTNVDPRFWKPLENTTVEITAGIPSDMPEGDYELYLSLPDPDEKIYSNPDYSIRFANKNIWNNETGYNNLNYNLKVGKDDSKAYEGNLFFEKTNK